MPSPKGCSGQKPAAACTGGLSGPTCGPGLVELWTLGSAELIVPYPACELPDTARVPSSQWLDASSAKGDTWDREK